jgi:hypothetical protein
LDGERTKLFLQNKDEFMQKAQFETERYAV